MSPELNKLEPFSRRCPPKEIAVHYLLQSAKLASCAFIDHWETVSGAAYRAQLTNPDFPELANKFLCRMLIADKAGEYKDAIYSAICAGWASDDAKIESAASAARQMSFDCLLKLNEKQQYIAQKGADEVLIADQWRRIGQFERARQTAEKGIALHPEQVIQAILSFEIALSERKDAGIHRISEALDP